MQEPCESNLKESSKTKVLHSLSSSLPSISGYTIRSHHILSNLKNYVTPIAIVGRTGRYTKKNVYIRDGIPYYDIPPFPLYYTIKECNHIKKLKIPIIYNYLYDKLFHNPQAFISKFIRVQNIDLIHDHSSGNLSNAVCLESKKKNIPYIYEVRGFVEESKVANKNLRRGDKEYIDKRKNKTQLMKEADAITTLGEAMKKEIIKRGVKREKISIVPNGIDTNYFSPVPSDEQLKKNLKIENDLIIGYIGSIRRLEGLKVLIKALSIVKRHQKNIKLLLVGPIRPKHYESEFKKLVYHSPFKNDIILTGLVPFKDIKKYYSIIDIFVLPRLNTKVTKLVTPLKPLEVMAMEKPIIASDLPALNEIIKSNISGDFFEPENSRALAERLENYLNNQDKLEKMGKNAREYVKKHYEWKKIVKKYLPLYEKLITEPLSLKSLFNI